MPASFPSSVKSFVTRELGDTIAASHVNDLQLEVAAIESDLLNATPTFLSTVTSGINATALSTGTVPLARLDANVILTSSTTGINATAISVGTIPDGRIVGAYTGVTSLAVGANVSINSSTLLIGNSTANTQMTATTFTVGANVSANSTTVFVGNSTSNTVITSGVVSTGNVSIVGVTTLQEILEKITISATAATGTVAFDALTQGVLYYTTNASANWTVNLRGNSTVSLNTVMSTGQSLTVAFLVSQGTTAYYANAHQVDGSSVTPKWQGGTAPTAGNISSVDIYSYTVVKTAASTFTVFASQTKFA